LSSAARERSQMATNRRAAKANRPLIFGSTEPGDKKPAARDERAGSNDPTVVLADLTIRLQEVRREVAPHIGTSVSSEEKPTSNQTLRVGSRR
jgi:hypothetical protein